MKSRADFEFLELFESPENPQKRALKDIIMKNVSKIWGDYVSQPSGAFVIDPDWLVPIFHALSGSCAGSIMDNDALVLEYGEIFWLVKTFWT